MTHLISILIGFHIRTLCLLH